jgi:hypothetical protein
VRLSNHPESAGSNKDFFYKMKKAAEQKLEEGKKHASCCGMALRAAQDHLSRSREFQMIQNPRFHEIDFCGGREGMRPEAPKHCKIYRIINEGIGNVCIIGSCEAQGNMLHVSARKAALELPRLKAGAQHVRQRLSHASEELTQTSSQLQTVHVALGCLPRAEKAIKHRMFYECFRLKDPETFDAGLLEAMDAILGWVAL